MSEGHGSLLMQAARLRLPIYGYSSEDSKVESATLRRAGAKMPAFKPTGAPAQDSAM